MYLSFYKLNEEPFRLTPDPRFLHLALPHRAVLNTLVEGILQHKGIITVTGPVGTGKTTLLHTTLHLLSNPKVSKTPIASAFLLNPTLSREELLEAILDEFEISCASTSKPRRLAALHQMLLETQRKGGTAVLIIDEAHLLTPELLEEIRLLNNADSYQEKLLQVILSGQSEMQPLLARPEMRALHQRIASRCQLRPLTQPETRAYIAERLHAAGLREPSPFSGSALEQIQRYTDGVPRLINLLCDASLSLGHAGQLSLITPGIVEEAAGTLELTVTPKTEPQPVAVAETRAEPMFPTSSVDALIEVMKQYRTSTPAAEERVKPQPQPVAELVSVVDARSEVRVLRSVVDVLIDAMRQNRAAARE
jgi:general secretion pathway protein A